MQSLTNEEGKKVCNKKKNRYRNVLPLDISRVRLLSNHENAEEDYINANYIKVTFISHSLF